MRDFNNGNPYLNAQGNLRGRYAQSEGVNRHFQDQLRQARQSGDTDGMQAARAGRAQFKQFRGQNPGMFGNSQSPMQAPTFAGNPAPDGGPEMNPGRQFANGNPYYNAQGELRNRYAEAGGVNQFYQGKIQAARQAGNMDAMEQYQDARGAYKDWNEQYGSQYGGDQPGESCPYCGK